MARFDHCLSAAKLLSVTYVLNIVTCRRQQYIGKAKFIEYMTAGHSTTRIIVATEQNVIASINAYNGHIGETVSLVVIE